MWPVSKWYMGSICHIFFNGKKKKKDFLSLKAWFSEIVHCREAEVTWVLWMYKHGNLRVTAPKEVNVIWPHHLTPSFPTAWASSHFVNALLCTLFLPRVCPWRSPGLPLLSFPSYCHTAYQKSEHQRENILWGKELAGLGLRKPCVSQERQCPRLQKSDSRKLLHLVCFDFEYNINVSYIMYSSHCTGGWIVTDAHLPQVHTTPTVTLPD